MKQQPIISSNFIFIALVCTFLSVSTFVTAQPPGGQTQSRPDDVGSGEYPSIKEEVASLPAHVIYRPQDLGALGSNKLGVVAWGNGGCSPDGASSRFHLAELASHGYLVIANGNILSGPGAPPRGEGQGGPGGGGESTSADQLIESIDWALAENARDGSPYYGKINEDAIAVSGFSCGGVQAIDAADDPRVDTLVLMNTGLFESGEAAMPGMDVPKEDLKLFHTSAIYILGGEEDIAYANGMDDYARIDHVPVAVASLPVGHGGTYAEENGGSAAQVAVKWLQWQLRDDEEAGKWFSGDNCSLCTDEEWSLLTKGF